MNIFFVFDDSVDVGALKNALKNKNGVLNLFPLTSNFMLINEIYESLPNITINTLPSAKTINAEVKHLQKNILSWSNSIANTKVANKKIKDWFISPDTSGSTWWYSTLSENNAVQETIYFKLAQINAIKTIFQKHQYDECMISISDKRMRKIVFSLADHASYISSKSTNRGLKAKIFEYANFAGIFGALINAAINWMVWLRDSRTAKKIKQRIPNEIPFLFISYFPNIDNNAAKEGIFKNKYALALQAKLKELHIPITWLLMPVYYNGHNFKSAMALADKFSQTENMMVLQQFFNLKVFAKSILWWLRQSILGMFLYRVIDKKILTAKLTSAEALPIIKYLWQHSFVGSSSLRGIIFYLTFVEFFKKIPPVKTSLYYCEMQAWEKAYLHAQRKISPQTKTLAFQHTVVGRNYFNYFYDKDDTKQHGAISDFPAPDMLIANGKQMYDLLAESGFPNLCQAEAIRQLYLDKVKKPVSTTVPQPILLVGGSCDRVEMKSLITMLHQAYKGEQSFKVWIKASPINPVEPLFAELKIDAHAAGYEILHTDVSELVQQATIALIANTTVAIEAAANNCPVIVPVFADTLLMNPLIETNAPYHLVATVEELKETIEMLLEYPPTTDTRNFIHHYWNIDPNIPIWTNILNTHVSINQ